MISGSKAAELKFLQDVRDLLTDPARWTQGKFARTAEGDSCYASDPEACQWCLEGAIKKVAKGRPYGLEVRTRNRLQILVQPYNGLHYNGLHYFNDRNLHEDVLALLDSAIAKLSGDEDQDHG